MKYIGKCQDSHVFQGILDQGIPSSFAERCPVPYCPHFITYKPMEVSNSDEETARAIADDLSSIIDQSIILQRHLLGLYEPLKKEDISKRLKEIGVRVKKCKSSVK